MIPKLIFAYGWPAAGKTTFSKVYCMEHPECIRIGADDIRKKLYGSEDIYGDGEAIYKEILSWMRAELKSGNDVIYDATNLRKQFRLDYLTKLEDIRCFKICKCISAPKEVCIKRHKERGRKIPMRAILPLFDIDEPPSYDEGWDKIEVDPTFENLFSFSVL